VLVCPTTVAAGYSCCKNGSETDQDCEHEHVYTRNTQTNGWPWRRKNPTRKGGGGLGGGRWEVEKAAAVAGSSGAAATTARATEEEVAEE